MTWLGDIAKGLKDLVVVQERMEVVTKGISKLSDRTDETRSDVVLLKHEVATLSRQNEALAVELKEQAKRLDEALRDLQAVREQFARMDGQWQMVTRIAQPNRTILPNGGPDIPPALPG